MDALNFDFIDLISNHWGLLAAGTAAVFNAMTVGWGSIGVMWEKPIVTVYVKPIRYTSEFLDREEYFTLSFFPDKYKSDLLTLGTQSGRSCDKLALTHLTPRATEHGIVFAEAEKSFVCRKLYSEPLKLEKIPDFAIEKYYKDEPPHHVYIGEIVEIRNKPEGSGRNQKLLTASCFGSFEAYAGGKPIRFRRSKTKELLAYLIDRRGAVVSTREICDRLWEDKAYDKSTVNYLHQLMSDLRQGLSKYGAENILIKHPQGYSVNVSSIDCDYYRFLEGDNDAVRSFTGEYMSKYSWSEYTCAYLLNKIR